VAGGTVLSSTLGDAAFPVTIREKEKRRSLMKGRKGEKIAGCEKLGKGEKKKSLRPADQRNFILEDDQFREGHHQRRPQGGAS